MAKSISEHEGKKYLRKIYSAVDHDKWIMVDVYSVLESFGVTCPAIQHLLKKLLATGNRGKGSVLDDLIGADAALSRAIDLQRIRERNKEQVEQIPDSELDEH